MRWLAFVLLSLPVFAKSQTTYLAAYEQQITLDFSGIKIEAPKKSFRIKERNEKDSLRSVMEDSLFKDLSNGNFLQKLLKEKFGGQLTVYLHVRADSVKAELESNSGGGVDVATKMKYEDGSWHTFNAEKGLYEKDSLQNEDDFEFTGGVKKVLGYTCHEARSKDSTKHYSVWICKDLPPTISPGIRFTKINGAIFEITGSDKPPFILRSIQKVTY